MDAAVAQLPVVEVGFLCPFPCHLRDTGHGLALPLTLLDLVLKDVGHVLFMDVEIVVYLTLDEVAHILIDGLTSRFHQCGTQLDLGLRLKHRLLNIDGDSGHNAVANIGVFVVFVVIFLDGLGNMLLESALVSTALCGVLTIDEAVILLAVLIGMGKRDLDVLALDMHNGIKRVGGHVVNQQILQSVAALDAPAIVHDGQARVEVSIVAEHIFHDFIVERIVLKQRVVRLKIDISTVFVVAFFCYILLEDATLERKLAYLSLTVASHDEMGT